MVLRTQKLGEADRIIWLLTSEHGQVRAVAKGVRRTTSKFGARLEPFSVVDIQLHRGRSLDTIIQVETIASHGEMLASDYELYSRASVIVETADKLSSDGDDGTHQQYLLLVGALHALSHRRHDPALILASYMLRAILFRLRSVWSRRTARCLFDHRRRCRVRELSPTRRLSSGS